MAKVSVLGISTAGGIIIGSGGGGWGSEEGAFAVVGDAVESHGPVPHNSPVMIEGSSWFSIDGIPVVVEGCLASCSHPATGEDWMDIPK